MPCSILGLTPAVWVPLRCADLNGILAPKSWGSSKSPAPSSTLLATVRRRDFAGVNAFKRVPNTRVSQLTGHTDPPIIVMQVREPHNNAEDYIASILEVLKALHVKRYSRIGAMYDAAPHTRPLQVSGTLNGEPMTGLRGLVSRRRSNYEGPTSIMNLLSQELPKIGVEDVSFMVRLPQYAQLEHDYAGTARLLEILSHGIQFARRPPPNRGRPQTVLRARFGDQQQPGRTGAGQAAGSPTTTRGTPTSTEEQSATEEQMQDLPADIQSFLADMRPPAGQPELGSFGAHVARQTCPIPSRPS